MPNTRDIRNRIKGVKSTRQITRAMQMVATSKMKKAQDAAKSGRPYALLLSDIIISIADEFEEITQSYYVQRPIKHRGILVVGTDKGLCGALNSNLFRKLNDVDNSAKFIAVGRRASQFLGRTQRDLLADFTLPDKPTFSDVRKIVDFLLRSYDDGTIDTIEILYSSFVNTLRQEPELLRLFPLNDLDEMNAKLHQRFGVLDHQVPKDNREILIENRDKLLSELASLYLKQEIFQLILESQASEHSARMVAMKTATDNAGNLIDDLTLQYNRARQAAITQEILEISAATFSKS
jgi:F-type H+-transporting ATPase subunit gamma